MTDIIIYPSETELGLADQIISNSSIACDLQFTPTIDNDIIELGKAIAAQNGRQKDLFYLDSVLVSVGWNNNDDVFDRIMTWNARHTPVDKPFNFEHDENDILGHITASSVYSQGQILPDNLPVDQLPDKFDIVVSSVIYSKKQNPESQQRVNEIIDGIKNNEWCVSMECLFPDFDYALISPDGSHYVIARDASTAHMTQYLRRYGGTGNYKGNHIGRLLKNMTFSGKGLVHRPANSRSIIYSFAGIESSINDITEEAEASEETNVQEKEKSIMSDVLQGALDKANAEIAELKQQLKDAHSAELTQAKAEIEALENTIQTQADKIANLETQIAEKQAELSVAQESVQEKDELLQTQASTIETLESEKAAIEAARVQEARATMLVEAGFDREEAEAKVATFAALDDNAFATYAEDMKKEKEEKKKMKEEKAKAGEDDDDAGEENATASIDEPEDVTTPSTEPNEGADLHSAASLYIGSLFKFTPQEEGVK